MSNSADIFRQVRDAVDIVDIIAEHIALKRAGKEFKCLCPFHDDHRPSMAVVPQKQIFHCFVCGTGGDVFKFVMNYHKMTAGEALRFLAQKAGIVIPELPSRSGRNDRQERSVREQLIETNERACGFFEKFLRSDPGKPGLEYLRARGLTDDTLAHWRLGYSPDNWTGLVTAAGRVGITSEGLVQAGLAKKRGDGSPYDAFRGRVMFPICDATGRVVAFGGRILVEKRDENGNVVEAKYLNSPETPVFNKSESLYGLHHAKASIIKASQVIVVEGYMDVIACHQAGVTNVVATLGTALTPEHARILRRFCETVVLVFDSDDAGHRAADRAMQTFVREPMDVQIASVPDGKDPCDFCMSHGGDAFRQVVADATEMIAFQWRRLQQRFRNTDSLALRQNATREFMTFVAQSMTGPAGQSMDPIRRGLLIGRLSELTGMTADEVGKLLAKAPASRNGPSAEPPAPSAMPAGTLVGPAAVEGWVLGTLLTEPPLYATIREEMHLDLFVHFRPLAEALIEYLENAPDLAACSLSDFVAALTDNAAAGTAIRLQRDAEAGGNLQRKLDDAWARLRTASETPPDRGPEQDELAALQRLVEARRAAPQPNIVLPPKPPDGGYQRNRDEYLHGPNWWKKRKPPH